ncbi:MAG: glycosyltransferase family 39 protein, partial [Candidatus Levybacteria bacterium]|nr:glycosyltransferase family 39 protein [Candidatus Levybacteria bacterium]
MGFLKQYKLEIIFFGFIISLFFFSRLISLLSVPIFTDEAIYLRWAQIAKNDAAWRFISLTDGKQPLFVWLVMIVMRFISDPLMAGRIVSVLAGFTTIVGLFFLGKEVFKNRWIGITSSFLYVIYPFALVYDRMALYDSLVGTFSVWGLYFAILMVRRLRLDIALILGMIIGAGVLNKTSGFFSLYLLPLTLILFDFAKKERYLRFVRWAGLALIAGILTYVYYSMLRLSPFFHLIDQKNAIFVYPLQEWLKHPFIYFWGNLSIGQWDWLTRYMTMPTLALVVISFFLKSRDYVREKALLIFWFAIPFAALALFGKTLYPRFIFFMTLSLLPLVAFSLFQLNKMIKNKIFFAFCFLLFAFLQLRSDYFILADFARAPIPESDLGQYINNWPAGGGINEIISFLEQRASKEKIYIATEGTFGSLPTNSVEIYLGDNKNVDKRGIWPLPTKIPKDLIEKAESMPVYFIFNETQYPPPPVD